MDREYDFYRPLSVVVDFPEKNKFLSNEQTNWIVARLAKDRGDVEPDPWSTAKLLRYVTQSIYSAFLLLHF
jgi:alpha-galactosidase